MIFTLDDNTDYMVSGVYLYRIGRLFYIGRSKHVRKRLMQHQKQINRAIDNYSDIVNSFAKKSLCDSCYSYIKHAKHILENPNICTFDAHLLFSSENMVDVCAFENKILRLYENHPDAINLVFRATILNKSLLPDICNDV